MVRTRTSYSSPVRGDRELKDLPVVQGGWCDWVVSFSCFFSCFFFGFWWNGII